MNRLFSIIIFLATYSNSVGQTYKFTVVDAQNNQPIPNAHICGETQQKNKEFFWVTDVNGTKENLLTEKAKIAISFIGYNTFIDSVLPEKSYKIKLTPKTETLNEVVITGQIKPETVDKSIYNVQVINKLDIKNKAANNLSDLLVNELNVKIENNGILGSNISMQGLSGEHIKILIDGVPVIGRQDGNIDLNQLNLQNIDHIEIFEGPMSVIYGSNALAGAINLITKKNTRPKIQTGANLYYETVGMYNADAFITKNFNHHHFSVTGGRNVFTGYKFDDYERTFTFYPKSQYFGTFSYLTEIKKLSINFNQEFFKEKLINFGAVTYNDIIIKDSNTYQLPFADDEQHLTYRSNSRLNLGYKLNETSKIDIITAYSYYQKRKNTYRQELYNLTSALSEDTAKHDTTFVDTYMSRGTYMKAYDKFEWLTGYDYNLESGSGKRIIGVKKIGEYAGFINFKYTPIKQLSVQGGGRYIYNTKYNDAYVFSINGKWDPVENINFRVSYGKGFRSPSLKELYLNFIDDSHNITGNPNLTPEYSENYNISGNQVFSNHKNQLKISEKFYYNRIRDKIDLIPSSDNSVVADYVNIKGIYKTIGYELNTSYQLHPRFKFNLGYGYSGKSQIADLNNFTYTHNFASSFNYYNLKYLFKINLYFKHYGKDTQYYIVAIDDEDTITETSRAAYNLMDLTVSRPFFNDRLDTSLGIKNLFDYKSVRGSGSSEGAHSGGSGDSAVSWGRTFFVKLSYTLTKF